MNHAIVQNSPTQRACRRLREHAWAYGLATIDDTELVALVLGHGIRGQPVMTLARNALEHVGGLRGLTHSGAGRLSGVSGLGRAKALRLAACAEVGRRCAMRQRAPKAALDSAAAVAQHFCVRIADPHQEHLWVASLDSGNHLCGIRRVAHGGAHALVIGAREVLRAALHDGATAFVMVHNHPSGDSRPSDADIEMTVNIARAAAVIGVPLLDHVVITVEGRYSSLLELGIVRLPEHHPQAHYYG